METGDISNEEAEALLSDERILTRKQSKADSVARKRNCNTLPIFCRRKGLYPSYTLKKFFHWSGNQCSLVPDYDSTVPLFPKSYFKIPLVP